MSRPLIFPERSNPGVGSFLLKGLEFFDTPARLLHDSGEASSLDVRSSRAKGPSESKVSRLPRESRGGTSRWRGRGSIGLMSVNLQGKLLNNTGSKQTAQCFI